MVAPLIGAVLASSIISLVINRFIGIVERKSGLVVAENTLKEKFGEVTLKNIFKQILPQSEYKKIESLIDSDPNVRKLDNFTEFLKDFNIRFAEASLEAGAISPAWGQAVSQLLGAIQWSFGLGWLSWMAMSPLLSATLTRPVEPILYKEFPTRQLTRSEVERLYKSGLIDKETAILYIEKLGYSKEYATNLIESIDVSKTEKERDLSKSDVINAYIKGVINRSDATFYLKRLGYSDEEIRIMLDLADERKDVTKTTRERDLTYSQILNAFRYGVLSKEEAKEKLMAIGYDEEEANIILQTEEAKLKGKTKERVRDLSKSEILRLFESGLINEDKAKEMLMSLGYDEEEAELLITLSMLKILQKEGLI